MNLLLLVFILVYIVTSLWLFYLNKKNVHILHIRRNRSEIQAKLFKQPFTSSPRLGERLTTGNRYYGLRNKMWTAFIKCSPLVFDLLFSDIYCSCIFQNSFSPKVIQLFIICISENLTNTKNYLNFAAKLFF